MTTGRPGLAPTARWLRDRMQGLGFSEDQFAVASPPPGQQLSEADLEPAHYSLEFASLVERVQRLLGGGRGVSIYVTGPRGDLLARHHLAAQLAVGLAPLGRQVVIVDADVLKPGLSGLLSDPDAEGLVDMVRFGRSTRSLLQHPVADGPWILPSGSFPADDPAPLAADALRSVVFRISQVCDLALYTGPLPIRNDIHPLARVCDHVLCAAAEHAEPDAGARAAEQLTELQRNGAHVLGLVWYAQPEPRLNPYETAAAALASPPEPVSPAAGADPFAFTPGALPAPEPEPPFEPGFLYSPDEPIPPAAADVEAQPDWLLGTEPPVQFQAFDTPLPAPEVPAEPASPFEVERFGRGAAGRPVQPEPAPAFDAEAAFQPLDAPALPTPSDWDAVFAPPAGAAPAPAPEFPKLPSFDAPTGATAGHTETAARAHDAGVAAREAADDAAHEAARDTFFPPGDATFLRGGAGAEPDAADRMRRARDESPEALPQGGSAAAEYSFESETSDSRWMPIVVVFLVALILVFVGWALWARHRVADEFANRPPVTAPQDAAAHGDVPAAGAPNDGAASSAPGDAGKTEPGGSKTEPAGATPDGARGAPPAGATVKPPPAVQAPREPVPPPAVAGRPSPSPAVTPERPAAGAAPAESAPQSTAPGSRTAVAEKPPAGTAAATGPFVVHVASYKTLGQASKEIAQLQKAGYTANAIETDLGSKGTWYRVYVGSYSTVAEAEAARDAILKLPGYNFAQVHRLPR